MRIYKRKASPYYWATWYQEGIRIRRTTGTKKRDEAEALVARWKSEYFLQKQYGLKPPVPFSKCLLRYAKAQKRDHGKSYAASTCYRLKTLTKYFGDDMANDIDIAAIRGFMDERMDFVKPASVIKEVSTLRAILNKAFEDGLLDVKPRVPKLKKPEGRTRWLTNAEEEKLVASVSNRAKHLVPIIRLACDTGGRRGELLALDWRDVDIPNRRLTFVETKNGENRNIRLCDRAVEVLQSLGPKSEGPVFTYQKDGLQTVTSSFETACKNAGLTDVTFHSLRHTFASRLVQGGVSLYETMSMMGHKSLDMVQRYAHHAPNYQDKAIEVLNARGHNMGTVPKEPQKAAGV